MSICRTCSKSTGWRPAPGAGARLLLCVLALVGAAPSHAQPRLTQDEALALAFPGATSIARRTAFLEETDLRRARAVAGTGVEIRSSVVTYYVGMAGSRPLGVAYFDSHRVR